MNFNKRLSIIGTKAFSSMWAFYIFFIWGLLGVLPGVPPKVKEFVLMVSSAFIQLWALPLIAVGNAVMNKSSERRAEKDHKMLMDELAEIKQIRKDLEELKKDS